MARPSKITAGGLTLRATAIGLFTFSAIATGWHHDWWYCALFTLIAAISALVAWKETR